MVALEHAVGPPADSRNRKLPSGNFRPVQRHNIPLSMISYLAWYPARHGTARYGTVRHGTARRVETSAPCGRTESRLHRVSAVLFGLAWQALVRVAAARQWRPSSRSPRRTAPVDVRCAGTVATNMRCPVATALRLCNAQQWRPTCRNCARQPCNLAPCDVRTM